ncbi:MAG TPA: AAA family ATPase, partial [Candidatus Eisenbacteria bacterium]
LDDGRLTDGQGRTVDFKNTLIVMTSNIGSDLILEAGGASSEVLRPRLMQALRGHFRPELINRIDEILVFEPLGQEELRQIVRLELKKVERRLQDRELKLVVDTDVLDILAKEGYDPVFGARPLRRVIEHRVQNPLAQAILKGEFKPGDTVRVRLGKDDEAPLRFERAEKREAVAAAR